MTLHEFAALMLEQLPFEPTDQQLQLVAALSRFCSSGTPNDSVFILNGYAGTGKTSLMGALVRTLRIVGIPTVLLASTGRAAKVFANFTGQPAHTIHRHIYRTPTIGPDGKLIARVNQNPHTNTVFIVDEASMIGDNAAEGMSLLHDLIMYVYTGINCRLILLGDTAQLPPVGLQQSPAMDPVALKEMGLRVTRATITRTVRQKARSGILYNATLLRRQLKQTPLPEPYLTVTPFTDVEVVMPEDLEEALQKSFHTYGEGGTLLVTRSNKRAVDFNRAIRTVIYDREEIIVAGDRLIISKNNYYWTRRSVIDRESSLPPGATTPSPSRHSAEGDSPRSPHPVMDFIANGEAAIVETVYATETRSDGTSFADVRLYFPDHDTHLDAKINLDTLNMETPSIPRDKQILLADHALADAGLSAATASVTAQREALKADPFYNALQVRYAYAVTCHKAQGGQWPSVFVDMGYIPPEAYRTDDFYRWLYTAVTRATTHLTLINPALTLK